MKQKQKIYRVCVSHGKLKEFEVVIEESDLLIKAEQNLSKEAFEELSVQRNILKKYIDLHPEFYSSFKAIKANEFAPVISLMSESSFLSQTGPMASVAGAIAEIVGRKLLGFCSQVIVENGGDIFLKLTEQCTVGIYAGNSPFSMKIGIKITPSEFPVGIATSSGKVGHSYSSGNTDSVTVISNSAAFSDGAATYFGNFVKSTSDLAVIPNELKSFPFITGIVITIEKELFVWGDIELVHL